MKRIICFAAAAIFVLAIARHAMADSPRSAKFDLTVEAGKHDRTDTPVAVLLAVPAEFQTSTVVKLVGSDQKEIPAQLGPPRLNASEHAAAHGATQRELDFILPQLKAGASARFVAEIFPAGATPFTAGLMPSDQGFHWKDTPGAHMLLTLAGRPVMQYMYHALDDSTKASHQRTYKPYHHVFDSTGKILLTKGPGGQDTHHRGLFYGFNRITYGEPDDLKHADTWQCLGDSYESHEGFLDTEAGPVLGRQLLAIDWHGEKKEVFAHERREMTVYNVPGGTLIDFASTLTTADGPVKLDGDPQHAGFHFRAPNEVAAKTSKQTYFVRPDGVGKLDENRNWSGRNDPKTTNLPWKGMCFVLGEKRYTAALIDRPSNPKDARYSERSYGRFGSYFVYTMTKDKPLRVAYRFWIQDGEMQPDQIARLADDFVEPPAVTVKPVE
ncbi:MAG TPA: DUF6807 family protein [Pirellulales bacterium]|jgi:hypothetical protein|nr:DUF6807 family protein [Pirellulales bacterium]